MPVEPLPDTDPGQRLLTDEEKTEIAMIFAKFKSTYGKELVAMGWDRAAVFGGLDPLSAVVVNDVPGVMAILLSGGRVQSINPNRIVLMDRFNWPLAWRRSGCFVGGQYFEELENTDKKYSV